jgi:hypothetical protein
MMDSNLSRLVAIVYSSTISRPSPSDRAATRLG